MALASLAAVACSGGDDGTAKVDDIDLSVLEEGVAASIVVTSSVFTDGERIPGKYSCYGLDQSPPISWSGVPDGTKSLALVSVEPDAPGGVTWAHWLLYGMPADVTEVPESMSSTEAQLVGGTHGTNDFNRLGWGGPCPPRGTTHFYFFKVYALDSELSLADGAKKGDLIEAMKGHVLGHGQLMGTYWQSDGPGVW
ncbi:MAG: YbhB/YbcL family Raf kinase inhibitor-like protein [Chloroflexi bacterium]|nr:YbhB/YbcL family Raf kinase inhibitor-like protein [Chloroflexota bacterium]